MCKSYKRKSSCTIAANYDNNDDELMIDNDDDELMIDNDVDELMIDNDVNQLLLRSEFPVREDSGCDEAP